MYHIRKCVGIPGKYTGTLGYTSYIKKKYSANLPNTAFCFLCVEKYSDINAYKVEFRQRKCFAWENAIVFGTITIV